MRIRCAMAVVAALALLGVPAPVLATDEPRRAGRATDEPDLTRFYAQRVKWGDCELDYVPEDMRCGQVTVPLDYAKPEKGTIDLAVNRMPASGEKRGSLLINFGGPGGAGVAGLANMSKLFDELTKSYDVVGFDPRGVGQSSPVTCGTADELPDPPSSDSDTTAVELEQLKKHYELCRESSGPVFDHIGTVNVSRDLDVLRQAVGDKKLNYLGFSYGTRIGSVYAAQFPKLVDRMVLDGVVSLTEPLQEQARVGTAGQQTALDNFIRWCVGQGCVLGPNTREARQNMQRLVDDLNERPIDLGEGMVYDGEALVGTLGSTFYHRDAWPYLATALTNVVQDRDPRALLRLSGVPIPPRDESIAWSLGRAPVPADEVPPDNEDTALVAVDCADEPTRPSAADLEDDAKVERLLEDFYEASPIFGPARIFQVLLCAGQPKGTDFISKIKNVDTPRFMLVGTRGDPATPYQWAVETAERLGEQAVLLDNRGEGHTGYISSKCVQQKVNDYLLYGDLPRSGLFCGEED